MSDRRNGNRIRLWSASSRIRRLILILATAFLGQTESLAWQSELPVLSGESTAFDPLDTDGAELHQPADLTTLFQNDESAQSGQPEWMQQAELRIASLEQQLTAQAAAKAAEEEKAKKAEAEAAAKDKEGEVRSLLEHLFSCGDPEAAICHSQCTPVPDKIASKKWYEKIGVRGYTQVRFNHAVSVDDDSARPQHVGDRSIEDNQSFLLRRSRLILFGDVSQHVYVYLQPDFSVTPTGSTDNTHFAQLRDWYADLYLTNDKEYRIRVGQSKIPYGWENLQSSSNRLPLDRNDALNSAARNERDLGIFFYWTPESAQSFFKDVMDQGLKGSGNYGMFAFGAYNGQGGSLQEQNDNVHYISRLTIPMQFEDKQYAEVAVQGYTGRYVVHSSPIRPLGIGGPIRPTGTASSGPLHRSNDRTHSVACSRGSASRGPRGPPCTRRDASPIRYSGDDARERRRFSFLTS